jgi:hypothetical protein
MYSAGSVFRPISSPVRNTRQASSISVNPLRVGRERSHGKILVLQIDELARPR